MGANIQTQHEDEHNLQGYLREGITLKDVKNIKRAFKMLDTDNNGCIKYEKAKIEDISKYQQDDDYVILNEEQFMELMIEKIIHHRKQFSDKIAFESNTSSVSCFLCPSRTGNEQ